PPAACQGTAAGRARAASGATPARRSYPALPPDPVFSVQSLHVLFPGRIARSVRPPNPLSRAGGRPKGETRMWLRQAGPPNPYPVYVGMLLTFVLGLLSYFLTPTDILPQIKMPVVVVFASYRGMPAPDMEKSVSAVLERAMTRCDNLEHLESRSLLGIGIIKVYFRPQVDPDVATSQVIALVNGEMQFMPPGMLPPTIFKLDASAIPVGQM